MSAEHIATLKAMLENRRGTASRHMAAERRALVWALGRFDLIGHLEGQRVASLKNFGPGERTAGVLAHIRKELDEVAAAPGDITEWIDIVILAFDGAMRAGHAPFALLAAWIAKQAKNDARTWPDWRTLPVDAPIEHIREPAKDA